MTKRINRKELICNILGCNIDDMEAYQPTRIRRVWTAGTHYYTVAKPGERLPTGYAWEMMPDDVWQRESGGYRVYIHRCD